MSTVNGHGGFRFGLIVCLVWVRMVVAAMFGSQSRSEVFTVTL